jgi:hypothetical protein
MFNVELEVTSRYSVLLEQVLARFSLIGFLQREKGCCFAVPPNFVPKCFAVPAHDFKRADWPLMPVLDLSQDRLDIFNDWALAQAGIGNWDQRWRDVVGKISRGFDLFWEPGIETDFFATHCRQKRRKPCRSQPLSTLACALSRPNTPVGLRRDLASIITIRAAGFALRKRNFSHFGRTIEPEREVYHADPAAGVNLACADAI